MYTETTGLHQWEEVTVYSVAVDTVPSVQEGQDRREEGHPERGYMEHCNLVCTRLACTPVCCISVLLGPWSL